MIANKVRAAWEHVTRKDFTDAWPILSDVLNEEPDNAAALYLAGCVMRSQSHVGLSLTLFRRALALRQDIPNIWMHYGAALHDTHAYDEARECFTAVLKWLPTDPMPYGNIAAGYIQQGKAREAVEWADKALAIDPNHTIAKIAKAFGCLALGRWAPAWEHIDALYEEKMVTRVYTPEKEPVWDGSKGKTVVVTTDQGLGDQIMFAQCLTEMARDCKELIIETSERMEGLFRRNFPGATVYGTLKHKGITWPSNHKIDASMHLSRIGTYYRRADEDFPKRAYLTPDPEKVAVVRKALEQYPRPWIGLAWRGGIPETNTKARSMELPDLAPVIKAGGTMISLAYQDVRQEIARWNIDNPEQIVVPVIDNTGDFDWTMALISELDHVVTVTTTAAHVCGAIGKRAYVLVNQVPQWRYAHGKDHLMWYPDSLTLYRQKPGEKGWEHAVGRLAKDYKTWVLGDGELKCA